MDMQLSPADLAFRDEVRAFLGAELTQNLRAAARATTGTFSDLDSMQRWHAILAARGWAAPGWPKEYGGPGWTDLQQYIFQSECAAAGAPSRFAFGPVMCGPMLMRYGTQAQKDFYLPRILSAEDRWCQGYSEPGSGSDLASLQTRAVADGDDYVVDGSKIWTTLAHEANRIFCLVRTDPTVKPQRGISFLLIDMKTPGISVRPIVNIAGEHEFNQVFFDGVRVPKANRLGEEGEGWTIAKSLLEFERSVNYAAGLQAALAGVRRLAAGGVWDEAAFRARFAEAAIGVQAVEVMERRTMSALSLGEAPGPAASILKLLGSELTQTIDELALEAVGVYAAPRHSAAPANLGSETDGAVMARYLYDRSVTIFGGTSEIQRNIVARAVLGL
jgi:acyl-CoA dehydrogenase